MNYPEELFSFIEQSPTSFHAIDTVKKELLSHGAEELQEGKPWNLQAGKSYFVTRNLSSLLAFRLPQKAFSGFQIIASHSDSPTFKVKENAEIEVKDHYIQLNTERYGGMLCASWLDRPLSVAGRLLVQDGSEIRSVLVKADQDLLLIPNLAIHMNRDANTGLNYNPQIDMLPLYGGKEAKGSFLPKLLSCCHTDTIQQEDILGHDLFLYLRMGGTVWGANGEFLSCPRLDDLECAFSSLRAFLDSADSGSNGIPVLGIFDNEEVGSSTKQGAASTFLENTLRRICLSLGKGEEEYCAALASSFMVSADNGHAVHPNHPEKSDPTNQPYLNGGVVLKYSANQKYTTDGMSAAVFRAICQSVQVPCQPFANRSDMLGGSTLGNISNTKVSLHTVDIGLAQLAMHSSYETAGVQDLEYLIRAMTAFYRTSFHAKQDGVLQLER